MTNKKQFSKNILGTFTAKGLSITFRLFIVILISHSLGKAGRGEISIISTNMMFLALIINFVGGSVASNLSAKYSLKSFLLPVLLWAFTISILSIPIFRLFNNLMELSITMEITMLTAIGTLAMCWYSQVLGSLMGRRKVLIRNMLNVVPFMIWFVFLFWCFNNQELTVLNYLYSFAFIHFASFAVGLFFLINTEKNGIYSNVNLPEVLNKGFMSQLAHFIMFFNYRLPFYVIEYFLGKGALGVYNNAVIIGENTRQLSNSIATVQHMEIINSDDSKKHLIHTSDVLRKIIFFSITLLVIPLFITKSIWMFIFGKDFGDIAILYPYLLPGMIFLALSSVYSSYFHGINKFKVMIKANLLGLIFMIISLLLVFVEHELVGACIAVSIAYFVNFVYYIYAFKKETGYGFMNTLFHKE